MRRVVALLVVLSLAVPASAVAQDNPFSPPPVNPNPTVAPPAPTATPTPTSSLSSTGATTLYIIGGALLVAFLGIGVWIARDARRALPESRRGEPIAAGGPTRRHTPEEKKRARQRAKAQRRARRRNR